MYSFSIEIFIHGDLFFIITWKLCSTEKLTELGKTIGKQRGPDLYCKEDAATETNQTDW